MSENEPSIIEGIGNEVLWCILIVVAVFCFVNFICKRNHRTSSIHSSNQNAVNVARRHLNHISSRLPNDADSTSANNPHFGSDLQCPICRNQPRYSIETNCGHSFCAQCLRLYWQHGNWVGALRCPVCNRLVILILGSFRDQNVTNDAENAERNEILSNINVYNRRFLGEPRPWQEYLWDLPTLLRHLVSEFFTVRALMFMFRLRILMCFVIGFMYVIYPFDIIPEAAFGILGLLDDVIVILLLAIYVTVIYRRFLASR